MGIAAALSGKKVDWRCKKQGSKLKVDFFHYFKQSIAFSGKGQLKQIAKIIRKLFIVSKGIYFRNEQGRVFSHLMTDEISVQASHLEFTEMKT